VLINLRGTHGSGKSTAIRALMEKSNVRPIFGTTFGLRCPEGYKARLPEVETDVFVLGPYAAKCGGCDCIQPYSLIPPLIEKYAARGHVIFEGALISTCWSVIGRLLERWKRDAIIVFLDTQVEECIRRVRTRRLERGDEREFDPGLLIQKHATVARLKQKIDAVGVIQTRAVSGENAASVVINLLEQRPTRSNTCASFVNDARTGPKN
jgi:hypothetical protein